MSHLQRIILILAAFGVVSIVLSQTGLYTNKKEPVANIHINSHNKNMALLVNKNESNTTLNTEHVSPTYVTNIYQSGSGSFYFEADKSMEASHTNQPHELGDPLPYYEVANILSTHADISVTGPIARTRLTQVFTNTSNEPRSGVYVFPLPSNAAVDTLVMTTDNATIKGVIKAKDTAKKMYQQAKVSGKQASLVAQLRPNIFTNSVANIPANSTLSVSIEYQQLVHHADHRYSLRVPLAITPRYTPNTTESAIPTLTKTPSKTHIRVSLNTGLPLSNITSEHHEILTSNPYSTEYRVVLDEPNMTTKDFVLNWQINSGRSIQASHFNYSDDEYEYGLITLMPPAKEHINARRNVVFVLDVSGSMLGDALDQAKLALALGIRDLNESDYFNVITFSSTATRLWQQSEQATPGYKDEALAYLHQLKADGGTEMQSALRLAFSTPHSQHSLPSQTRLNQVVFITDGSVSNEAELMRTINEDKHNFRLFTVGIGSAPNAYFMRQAAMIGKGTFTFIGDVNQVENKMTSLLAKLKSPALTNLTLSANNSQAFAFEVYPSTLPDLYADMPLELTYRRKLSTQSSQISPDSQQLPFIIEGEYLSATADGGVQNRAWSSQLPALSAQKKRGLHKHWARMKIQDLTQQLYFQKKQAAEDDKSKTLTTYITNVALKYGLVSQFTSLVAVETDAMVKNVAMQKQAELAKAQRKHSRAKLQSYANAQLPQTATPAGIFLLSGTIMSMLGAFIWLFRIKRYEH